MPSKRYACPECGLPTANVATMPKRPSGTQFAHMSDVEYARQVCGGEWKPYGLLCNACMAEDKWRMGELAKGRPLSETMTPGWTRDREIARDR
jgi:hypothetical protein